MVTETVPKPKALWAALSVLPLPGADGWQGDMARVISRVEQEASALASGGVDGIVLDNRLDAPFGKGRMEQAGAIALADLTRRIRALTGLPVGITVYRNDVETALGIALNAEADFVRVPLLVGAMIEETGVVEGALQALTAFRRRIRGTAGIPLWVDVSIHHVLSQPFAPGESPVAHLAALIRTIEAYDIAAGLILTADNHTTPPVVLALKDQHITDLPMIIAIRADRPEAGAHYAVGDGLLLAGGLEKSTRFEPGLPPAVDMVKTEETVSRLKKIKSVDQIDPDFFLSQMYQGR